MIARLPHHCPGTNAARHTAILLSCPGYEEAFAGRPVAGRTGVNLELLLGVLGRSFPETFPSADRYDYTITNSVSQVHYKSRKKGNHPTYPPTGDTEPRWEEVALSGNIARLLEEIGACTTVLALGDRAGWAIDLAVQQGYGGHVMRSCRHLSMQGLNHIHEDVADNLIVAGGGPENTVKRIAVVAREIVMRVAAEQLWEASHNTA